ncbi:sucrose nonfermenting protein [Trifolium repens]|nr:sucrose nonfermenting protein [Trifolium repens]
MPFCVSGFLQLDARISAVQTNLMWMVSGGMILSSQLSHMEVDNDVFGHADIAVSPGLLFLTVTAAIAQNVPTKRAVLVGTEYYLDNRKLRGCAGNAKKMRDTLISYYGFNIQHTQLIVDAYRPRSHWE